jgi:hypothetical protein
MNGKQFFFVLSLLIPNCLYAQELKFDVPIDTSVKSFGKGRVLIFKILGIFRDSMVVQEDTLIGNRVYYKYQFTQSSIYKYFAEDNDGSVWMCSPFFKTKGEICFLPQKPFIGYSVQMEDFGVKIIGIHQKVELDQIVFEDLIVVEVTKPDDEGYSHIEYFKKGVGWIASVADRGSFYLKRINYHRSN